MAILTRDQILGANDRKLKKVDVPEWGGEVFVRGLTGAERDWYEQAVFGEKLKNPKDGIIRNVRATFVSMGVVDEKGNSIFTSVDIEKLGEKSAEVLDRVADEIRKLSGLTIGAVEAGVENLEKGQSDDSISG